MNQHANEFHLGRNAVIVLVVVQLTALMFGIMTLNSLTGVNCTAYPTPKPVAGASSICNLEIQSSGINQSVHNLVNSYACVTNSSMASCYISTSSGSLLSVPVEILNVITGTGSFLGYSLYIIAQLLYMIVYILTIFFPSLFSAGVFGGFGFLFGIIFDGATLIMVFYLMYLLVRRLPWIGNHA